MYTWWLFFLTLYLVFLKMNTNKSSDFERTQKLPFLAQRREQYLQSEWWKVVRMQRLLGQRLGVHWNQRRLQ